MTSKPEFHHTSLTPVCSWIPKAFTEYANDNDQDVKEMADNLVDVTNKKFNDLGISVSHEMKQKTYMCAECGQQITNRVLVSQDKYFHAHWY